MGLESVYDAVGHEKDRYVADLQRLIRQPSVSSQNIGVSDCAALLVDMMEEVGITAKIMPTAWHPVVYGEIRSPLPDAPTLLITNHYDVQPADPVELWTHEPFGAELVDGVIYGRGATDAKGNLIAHLKAIDAYRVAGQPLPCNIKFLLDGEEESGSPSLPDFLDANREQFMADAVLTFDAGFDAYGKPRIQFGSSGMLFVEIRAQDAKADLHSGRARLAQNPAWRLVWALNKLKTEDGRVHLPGFYDGIWPVTEADRAVMAKTGFDDELQRKDLGVDSFVGGVTGLAAFEQLIFTPTCNIAGFAAGYTGDGKKSVLPAKAMCRIDFRLVAGQDPVAILASLRKFFDDNGCSDFELESKSGIEPSRTPVDNPFAGVVIGAAEAVYPQGPSVVPTGDASGRQAVWVAHRLGGLPAAFSGMGPPAWRGHAPDEFMTVSHLMDGIKYSATIMDRFGKTFGKSR